MTAIERIHSLCAKNDKARAAMRDFIAAIPKGYVLTSVESGPRRDRSITFSACGIPFYRHKVMDYGHLRPITGPVFRDMKAALETRFSA